jgi:hypothetical protein
LEWFCSQQNNHILSGARQAQFGGSSIAISPDFQVKVYGKPKSIGAWMSVSRQKVDPKGESIPVQSERIIFLWHIVVLFVKLNLRFFYRFHLRGIVLRNITEQHFIMMLWIGWLGN